MLSERIDLLKCYCADPTEVKRRFNEVQRLSSTYQSESRRTASARTVTSEQVGDELESLLNYILSQTTGVLSPLGPLRTPISELDNVLKVKRVPGSFLHQWHPITLVECKNYGGNVSKKMVSDFIGEVRRAAECRVGLIMTRKGISRPAEMLAINAVGQMAEEHRHYILVLNDEFLARLVDGDNLFDLLERIWIERCVSCA